MAYYKSLRDRCSYRSWNCLGNKSHEADPIWWNYVPGYGMLEKSGSAMPPVYFKGVKNIMKNARSDSLKLDVIDGHTDIVKCDMKLSNSCVSRCPDIRNKIYELVCTDYEID